MRKGLTRREVLAGAAGAAMAGAASTSLGAPAVRTALPKALVPGSRVALCCPASRADRSGELDLCMANARAFGWEPVLMPNTEKTFGYLNGTDQERADDLNAAFADKSIDGIFCVRGGYGAMRILPLLDEKAIRRSPKALIGFSDITALLAGLNRRCGLVGFHGPNALSTPNPYSDGWLRLAVTRTEPMGLLANPDPLPSPAYELKTLAGGKGEGRLVGGNLCLLSHLMGTPWEPDLSGAILFIEDVAEAPYRVDRMMAQLAISGQLERCAGVVIGQFTNCDEQDADSPWKVADVMRDRFNGAKFPVVSGWAIGHVRPKITLPVGCRARLDGDAKTLEILEPAVAAPQASMPQ